MSARRPRTYPAGSPERAVADAVAAVYAEADLRLEALQLDLLEPRPDGTRWTVQQVKDRRTTWPIPQALRGSARGFGRAFAESMERIAEVVRPVNRALVAGYVNVARTIAAAGTTTRDDYTLAGPSKGVAS